jgi:hypothetical protein
MPSSCQSVAGCRAALSEELEPLRSKHLSRMLAVALSRSRPQDRLYLQCVASSRIQRPPGHRICVDSSLSIENIIVHLLTLRFVAGIFVSLYDTD